MSDTTSIETKLDILSDFYLEYKGDEKFADFFSYNDLGLPISYAISSGIVSSTKVAEGFINETFELLCQTLGYWQDEGFETLEDMIAGANM
jgi:hypothetical protein